MGIGLADFCHRRVIDAMDIASTELNAITSGRVALAKLPTSFTSEREMLDTALASIGSVSPDKVRLVWIRNTLKIAEFAASEVYLDEVSRRGDLEILTEPAPLVDLMQPTTEN